MQTPDEEAKAFAESFIALHTDWKHDVSNENVRRVEKIAEEAKIMFHERFPLPVYPGMGGLFTETSATRQRRLQTRLKNGCMIVYMEVIKAGLSNELHGIIQIMKMYLDEEKLAQGEDKKLAQEECNLTEEQV